MEKKAEKNTNGVENAVVMVKRVIVVQNVATRTEEEELHLEVVFTDVEETKSITIPYADLESGEIIKQLEKMGVVFKISGKDRKRFLNELRLQRRKVTAEKKLQLPQGPSQIDGIRYWNLGNHCFSCLCSEEKKIKHKISNVYDDSVPILRNSKSGSFETALNFMFIDKQLSPMLILYLGACVWDELLCASGITHRYTLYVVGKTGTKKSSICRELTSIYEERTEMTFASSYAAIMKQLQRYSAVPILIDDFNESDFTKIKKEKGMKLAELIQLYSDRGNSTKYLNGKVVEQSIRSGLIVTAEKPLNNPSTMNRCIVVSPLKVKDENLSFIQKKNREQGIFSDLICEMIKYSLENYNDLLCKLPNWYEFVRNHYQDCFDYKETLGYSRIIESYYVSLVIIQLWREFLEEKCSEKMMNMYLETLQSALEISMEETFKTLNQADDSLEITEVVYECIKIAIANGQVCQDRKKYIDKVEKYVGLYEDNLFYIKGELLENMVCEALRKKISRIKIADALYRNGRIVASSRRYLSKRIPNLNSNNRHYCLILEDDLFDGSILKLLAVQNQKS